MRNPSLREKGFTLIEVMISTGLLTIVVGSLMGLLADYSQYFQEAQEKSSLMTLRRRIIQNLNRRDSWVITYRAVVNRSTFECFLHTSKTANDCPADPDDRHFVLYSGRTYPEVSSAVVFSRYPVPSFTPISTYGLTARGAYCNTFNKSAKTGAALRCPFRLDLTWELLTFGIPNDTTPGQYFPTGYMPSGYYIGDGSESYFKDCPAGATNCLGAGYFNYPGGTNTESYYWWTGTLAAQIRVKGTFSVNDHLKTQINTKSYDFSIIKEVP